MGRLLSIIKIAAEVLLRDTEEVYQVEVLTEYGSKFKTTVRANTLVDAIDEISKDLTSGCRILSIQKMD
jgi:hypothetical protein